MAKIFTLTRSDRLASNCYFLVSGKEAAVIDPSVRFSEARARIPELPEKIKYVILTHAHADHFWEISSFLDENTEVLVSQRDSAMMSDGRMNCSYFLGYDASYMGRMRIIADNDKINVGDECLNVMSTPGHTAGSLVYYTEEYAFTGDTLFERGGYGRVDLPTGNYDELVASLGKLFAMPDSIVIYPGHGAHTTLKETKMYF